MRRPDVLVKTTMALAGGHCVLTSTRTTDLDATPVAEISERCVCVHRDVATSEFD